MTRTGATLVELVIALTILGALTAIVSFALPSRVFSVPADDPYVRLAAARRHAVTNARDTTIAVIAGGRAILATAHMDGSVVVDSGIVVDRLSGRIPADTMRQRGRDSLPVFRDSGNVR